MSEFASGQQTNNRHEGMPNPAGIAPGMQPLNQGAHPHPAPRPPMHGMPFNPYGSMLSPGWTEHMAPTGQLYWYNSMTGQSTWQRPMAPPAAMTPPEPGSHGPPASQALSSTTTASTAPASKKTKVKKTKKPIPGTHWLLVRTGDGLEFYFDKETKQSVWEVPKEIEEAVAQLKNEERLEAEKKEAHKKRKLEATEADKPPAEQVENDAKQAKTSETTEKTNETPEATEMTEEDIMWQLQNMDPEEMAALGLDANLVAGGQSAPPSDAAPQQTTAPAPAAQAAPAQSADEPSMTEEERVEQFTRMLSEKNISPFSTWEKELPKFINDSRYTLVQPHNKRKNLFNNFCRILAEEQKAKKASAKTPEEQYMSLLKDMATDKMYWDDFRRKARNDERFKAIRESKVRESMFKDYVKKLRKSSTERHERHHRSESHEEEDYKQLLRETSQLEPGMRWRDAKLILEKDKRYHALESRTRREDLFRDYIAEL